MNQENRDDPPSRKFFRAGLSAGILLLVISAGMLTIRHFYFSQPPQSTTAPAQDSPPAESPPPSLIPFDREQAAVMVRELPAKIIPQTLLTAENPLRVWQYIVIHHSGSIGGSAAAFDRAHRERGMENGLAYHFVIGNGRGDNDGELVIGGRWKKQLAGGHLRGDGLNEIALGICLTGDFTKFAPTAAQISTLKGLLQSLKKIAPNAKIIGHGAMSGQATVCPGELPVAMFNDTY